MSKKKAVIYVETIAGVGHMPVAAHMAQSLMERDFDVYIMASQHSRDQGQLFDFGKAEWCMLPTFLKDPETGKAQFTPNGKSYKDDPEFQQQRSQAIQAHLNEIKPDVLVTETWPLGKGHFDAEMIPAFENCPAMKQCKKFVIGRDVMNYPNHRGATVDSDARAAEIVNKYYDGVIITGDEKLFTMNESFQHAQNITVPVYYAGYFAQPSMKVDETIPADKREVLVTTGGGYVKEYDSIIEDAMRSRSESVYAHNPWRVIISDAYPLTMQRRFKDLAQELAPDGGIIVEGLRPDFRQLMSNSTALITAGGLNSTIEAFKVRSRKPLPIVITPIGKMGDNPSEQVARTQKLVEMELIGGYFPNQYGNPQILARIFNDEVARTNAETKISLKTEGSDVAARIIQECVDKSKLQFTVSNHRVPYAYLTSRNIDMPTMPMDVTGFMLSGGLQGASKLSEQRM